MRLSGKKMEKYEVSLLQRMLEFYSPTGSEAQLSVFLSDTMEAAGIRTHIDKAGNVIGEFGEGRPTILLCGHLDTVPGNLQVKLEGGRLYGRGAVDAKAPLASIVSAASALKAEDFQANSSSPES